jgi:hypothetical protein
MKELAARSPSVIASMVFMAMLHAASWRPNYDEAEQAERQDKMNDLSSAIASIEVANWSAERVSSNAPQGNCSTSRGFV